LRVAGQVKFNAITAETGEDRKSSAAPAKWIRALFVVKAHLVVSITNDFKIKLVFVALPFKGCAITQRIFYAFKVPGVHPGSS
jgi:hypothetical protein